ncbi:MAG: hypothetical protein FJ271_32950 [Planctomycetes bacterium]|nr:hypothetical protein [Planctomycetota bacterium]
MVKGLSLPPKGNVFEKECRTPFNWSSFPTYDPDGPLATIQVLKPGEVKFDDFPLEWLEKTEFVVLEVNWFHAEKELDLFPATWRALAYIVSDRSRMGAGNLNWDMKWTEFASARIHALFCRVHNGDESKLLATQTSKEELGLCDFQRLPEHQQELEYYHYLSVDSAFTNQIVELFGISHRCWHGCGYLGWPEYPICRFFLLRNKMTAGVKVATLGGRDRFMFDPGKDD